MAGLVHVKAKRGQARLETIASRSRPDDRWPSPPVKINARDCIVCDACQRSCPAHFGAIVNSGLDVKVIPELCSGCGICLRACPIGCIHPDEEQVATSGELWALLDVGADPYVDSRDPLRPVGTRES